MTPRQTVVHLVETYSASTGKPCWKVWTMLYDEFERIDGKAVRRTAHNTFRTEIDTVDEEGWMPLLLARAVLFLKVINPALPEKEKAPVQGSLLEGGLP